LTFYNNFDKKPAEFHDNNLNKFLTKISNLNKNTWKLLTAVFNSIKFSSSMERAERF